MVLRQAVIPIAGYGTRMRAITGGGISKEILMVDGMPLVIHSILEAAHSGVSEILIILNKHKGDVIECLQNIGSILTEFGIAEPPRIDYAIQDQQIGLSNALLCAKPWIQNEHFGVLLPDDYIKSDGVGGDSRESSSDRYKNACLAQMVGAHTRGNMIAIGYADEPQHYGVLERPVSGYREVDSLKKLVHGVLVEKPPHTKSHDVIVGRYLLNSSIFSLLESDFLLPNALNESGFVGYKFDGEWFDCGSEIGWRSAV